ncbi:MAG: hypothetical protein AAGJ83_13535, partial [Planctomycetota bacterium]
EFLPLHAMLGYAELHCSRSESSLQKFDKVLAAPSTPDDPVSILQERSRIGKIWACLDLKQLESAGALLSEAQNIIRRSRGRRNVAAIYELNLAQARFWELRGRKGEALKAYTRAINADRKRPEAHRLVAVFLATTDDSAGETALIHAEQACDLDESRDFRNYIAVAHAHHALAQTTERDRAMADARKYAASMNAPDDLIDPMLAAITKPRQGVTK